MLPLDLGWVRNIKCLVHPVGLSTQPSEGLSASVWTIGGGHGLRLLLGPPGPYVHVLQVKLAPCKTAVVISVWRWSCCKALDKIISHHNISCCFFCCFYKSNLKSEAYRMILSEMLCELQSCLMCLGSWRCVCNLLQTDGACWQSQSVFP